MSTSPRVTVQTVVSVRLLHSKEGNIQIFSFGLFSFLFFTNVINYYKEHLVPNVVFSPQQYNEYTALNDINKEEKTPHVYLQQLKQK